MWMKRCGGGAAWQGGAGCRTAGYRALEIAVHVRPAIIFASIHLFLAQLLYDTFSAFGVIVNTPKIMRDPETGNSRGFGFVR